jgi:2'-5' RNA ligase
MRAATREFARTRDELPFVPHLTLARRGVWPRASRFRGAGFEEMLGENQATVFTQWVADRVILFRSELQPKGAKYTSLCVVILASSSPAR